MLLLRERRHGRGRRRAALFGVSERRQLGIDTRWLAPSETAENEQGLSTHLTWIPSHSSSTIATRTERTVRGRRRRGRKVGVQADWRLPHLMLELRRGRGNVYASIGLELSWRWRRRRRWHLYRLHRLANIASGLMSVNLRCRSRCGTIHGSVRLAGERPSRNWETQICRCH